MNSNPPIYDFIQVKSIYTNKIRRVHVDCLLSHWLRKRNCTQQKISKRNCFKCAQNRFLTMNTFKWRSFLHVLENKLSKTCVVAMWAQIIITYFHFHRHYCVVCDGIFATSYVHNESRCFQLWHFTVFFSVQALSLSSNSRSHNFNRKLNHNYNFFIHYFDDWQWRRYKDAQCSAASSSIILKFLFLATCHDIVLATVFALHKHTHTHR